jgi:hypothetical protein
MPVSRVGQIVIYKEPYFSSCRTYFKNQANKMAVSISGISGQWLSIQFDLKK